MLRRLMKLLGLSKDEPAAIINELDIRPRGETVRREVTCFVVDDEPDVCRTISHAIKSVGATTAELGSADELLNVLDNLAPQLIFLDISLGRSDAIEALRGLASREFCGAVQLMSGKGEQLLSEVRAVGTKYGLNMLPPITKPFSANELRNIARAYVTTASDSPEPVEVGPSVDLDLALDNDWIDVWYQPKIDIRRKLLVGLEALARVKHPDYGIMSPNRVLKGATSASMQRLSAYMIKASLRHWRDIGDAGFFVKIAVNVSVDCLLNAPIAKLVRENRPTDGSWPGLLLELTEEQVIRDISSIQEIATQLKIYDISISVDDFGAGYSSFNRLKQFPFSELKLDGSFVRGCARDSQNRAICQAVVDLAHSFGATAVAECVEDPDDLLELHRMGCDIAQGYLLCPPLPLDQLLAMLRAKTHDKRQKTIGSDDDDGRLARIASGPRRLSVLSPGRS